MSDELPQGWVSLRLEELVSARKGKKPGAQSTEPSKGYVPYLDIQAIEKGEVSSFAEAASSRLGSADDVLVVWDGARSGWAGLGREGAIGSTIMALQAKAGEPSYIYRWLQSQFNHVNTNTRGTGIPHVDPEVFWNLEIPLAPLAEQRRIVAKLTELLGKVDACQQRLAKIPVLLKRFRQSVLAAACSGRLTADWREENPDVESPDQLIRRIFEGRNKRYKATCDKCVAAGTKPPKPPKNLGRQKITRDDIPEVPEGWEIVRWDDLADWITYGFTRPMPHVAKGIPIITAKNVRDGFLDWAQPEYTTREAFAELSEKDKPRRNEILITKDGAIRGRAALVETDEPFCISQAVAVVRFGGETAYEPFLVLVVRSKYTQNLIEEESMGTAIPHISITNFGRFPVPLPPLAEQQEIVRRVEALFALADQIEARFTQARKQVDKLTPSLLARAFAGKLVPQDPTDEPAEKLLERMRNKVRTKTKR